MNHYNEPIVVNIFGGPGVGKSTLSAGLFYKLKSQGCKCELVTEYAKELVFEDRKNILKDDQFYVFAKQNRKIFRLLKQDINFIITDSPILLSKIYGKYIQPNIFKCFCDLIDEINKSYCNFNIFLERNKSLKFENQGRLQKSLNEAQEIDNEIYNLLIKSKIQFNVLTVDDNILNNAFALCMSKLEKKHE